MVSTRSRKTRSSSSPSGSKLSKRPSRPSPPRKNKHGRPRKGPISSWRKILEYPLISLQTFRKLFGAFGPNGPIGGRSLTLAIFSALLLFSGIILGLILAPSSDHTTPAPDSNPIPSASVPQDTFPSSSGAVRMSDPLAAEGTASSTPLPPLSTTTDSTPSAVPPTILQDPSSSLTSRQSHRKPPSPPKKATRPMIAIVIDDMGIDRKRTQKVIDLPAPLTTSFMTYAENIETQAARARRNGHELFVHVPMEPQGTSVDPGPDVLTVSMSEEQIIQTLERILPSSPTFVGINNHMGSRFTENLEGMRAVMSVLKQHGLLFLDSKTTPHSVGARTAQEAGIPYAERAIFIDHQDTPDFVQRQLTEIEAIARQRGSVIAIGHPKDNTIAGLKAWLPTLSDKGFILVPASSIIHQQTSLKNNPPQRETP